MNKIIPDLLIPDLKNRIKQIINNSIKTENITKNALFYVVFVTSEK